MSCKYCQATEDNGKVNESWGDDAFHNNSLHIVKYGDKHYLHYGTGNYDEYDTFDLEAEIEFCPKCGRKL